jgi:hypothetical protein
VSYTPIPTNGFGAGLNLRDKVDAVSEEECIDALNVEFSERGSVSQRAGYEAFTDSALTNAVGSLHAHYRAAGTPQLLAGCGTRLEAIPSDGSAPTSLTGLTTGTWDFARFGTPNSEISYAGQGETTLRSWNGTAWATVSNTPKAGALAVFPASNRLVAARFNTTDGGPTGAASTSSPSHIYFSNALDATTWDADDFDQLTPGDGEKIQAVISWREFTFAFKETKFFVYHGEDQAADGTPIFRNTPIDTGVGLASPRAVCADERGVYFLDRKGVYRTTGGEPELLSDIIDPIFRGGTSDFYLGGELSQANITNCAMTAHDNRIYLSFGTGSTNNRTLVYDTERGWWSLYDIAATALISYKLESSPELFFGYATGSNDVGRHNSTETNDDGVAITSRWRSGWFDFDIPEVKKIRESKVWGTGKVFLGVSRDFLQGTGTLSALDFADTSTDIWGGTTWGGGEWATPAGLISRLRRKGPSGGVFSTYFTNDILDQSWSVHRLDHHLREKRIPSVKSGVPGT